jgi:hypothetical protein
LEEIQNILKNIQSIQEFFSLKKYYKILELNQNFMGTHLFHPLEL